jgi:hypothetical protein
LGQHIWASKAAENQKSKKFSYLVRRRLKERYLMGFLSPQEASKSSKFTPQTQKSQNRNCHEMFFKEWIWALSHRLFSKIRSKFQFHLVNSQNSRVDLVLHLVGITTFCPCLFVDKVFT